MAGLITVDRYDGPAVAGLLTAVLTCWDDIPLDVQASLIDHAGTLAFDGSGRTDGRSVVAAFVLKHRAALARQQCAPRAGLSNLLRTRFGMLAEATARWPVSQWLIARRRAA